MLEVTTYPKAKGGTMSEQEIPSPDPTTIDGGPKEPAPVPTIEGAASPSESDQTAELVSSPAATEATSTVGTEADPTGSPVVTADSTSAVTAGNASDVSGDAPSAVPQVHRFRIVHEIANEGETVAHSIVTSAPLVLQDALTILADLARLGI